MWRQCRLPRIRRIFATKGEHFFPYFRGAGHAPWMPLARRSFSSLNPILLAIPSKNIAGIALDVSQFPLWGSMCRFRFVELASGRCRPFLRVAPG
jgi:hypothetical protein